MGGVGERLAGAVAAAVGNEEIVTEIERRLRPGEMMASESYTNVHLVAFLSGGTLPTRLARVRGGAHGLASLYWYRPEELIGRNFLFVTEREGLSAPLSEIFTEVTEEPPFLVERGGTVVRRVLFLRCRDLRHPEGTFTRLAPSRSPGPSVFRLVRLRARPGSSAASAATWASR